METFERYGNAILREAASGDLEAVRMWGRMSVDQLCELTPNLVAKGDPVETMMRFRVQRATFQTMGFFERLLAKAAARDISARFEERSWAGDARTLLALDWSRPG